MSERQETGSLVSPRRVMELLTSEDIHPRRSLGQNFLVDGNILRIIVEAADLLNSDTVIEIGPGLGALTQALVANCGFVIAVENDRRLAGVVRRELGGAGNLRIVEEDAMRCGLESLLPEDSEGKVKMVANLPYNIAATLVVKCLQDCRRIVDYVVMVQQEVAERLLSGPGTRSYSAATVRICCRADVRKVADVSRNCFYPKPKVDSTVIEINRKEEAVFEDRAHERLFESIVTAAFGQRRKKIANSVPSSREDFSRGDLSEALASLGKNPHARAEDLSPEDYIDLSKLLVKHL